MDNYNQMTIEDLEAANEKLMAQKAAILQQQRELVIVLDAKRAEKNILSKLGNMSEAERQVLRTAGIPSEEIFGHI